MRHKNLLLAVLAGIVINIPANAADKPSLNCDVGPAHKTYGKTPWLVYSCNDDKSIVIVSAPDSPATPFYFSFLVQDGAHHLVGEGTGNKAATDAAYNELKKLSEQDIARLVTETKLIKPSPKQPGAGKFS